MEQSYKRVFSMAYRLAGNRTDAEDLTQEAFYRAYRSFEDYEGDKPFENWIFRIATRLFLDMLRNRKRRVRAVSLDSPIPRERSDGTILLDLPDRAPTPEHELLGGMLSEDLNYAMMTLTKEQRMLVVLADVECWPYKDIADALDKPVGTIRSRLHRTHRLLRTRLEMIEREKDGSIPLVKLRLRPTMAQ